MNKIFGYARVSTESQNLAMQVDLLLANGVNKENIYAEKESGAKLARPELDKLLTLLREGDMILFYDLSRLGRSLSHLITIIDWFKEKKIDFKDLSNPAINTKNIDTPAGWMIFAINAVFSEYQRKDSNAKVLNGIARARKEGRIGGRPKGLSKELKVKAPRVAKLYLQTDMSIKEIAATLVMAPNSVYKCLKHEGIPIKLDSNRATKNKKVA